MQSPTKVQPRVEIEAGQEVAPQLKRKRARESEQRVMLTGVTVLAAREPREWIARREDCAEQEYKLLPSTYAALGQAGDLETPDFLAISGSGKANAPGSD